MKSLSVWAAAVLLLVSVTCCAWAAEADGPALAIEKANAAFAAAFAKGDAKAVAEMYTDTAQLFPPNAEIVGGRTDIEQFWKTVMAAGIARVELATLEVDPLGDTIVETGKATLFDKAGMVLDRAKYLVVWKKVDGKWKLHRDFWNSNLPARAN